MKTGPDEGDRSFVQTFVPPLNYRLMPIDRVGVGLACLFRSLRSPATKPARTLIGLAETV